MSILIEQELCKVEPINEAEAIFLPLFDPKLHDISQFTVETDGAGLVEFAQISEIKVRAKKAKLRWQGKAVFKEYDKIRFFISFPSAVCLSGFATLDGRRVELFRNIKGDKVPIEPTSGIIGKMGVQKELTSIDLEFEQKEEADLGWNICWVGLVNSLKEPQLDLPLEHPKNWDGFLKTDSLPSILHPWIGSVDQIKTWKERLQQPKWKALRDRMREQAQAWDKYDPERHIREFLPVEEHLYRFARVRDRGRPLWDTPMMVLALAGYMLDEPKWSQKAARLLLSTALTPHWFEGPQGCFPGSDWHHVCFVESHNLVASIFALQFMGNVLTEQGRRFVIQRIKETWPLINEKCEELGYRWYMNQGVVFNSARLAGAVALWMQGEGDVYREKIQKSYKDHCIIIDNYLSTDGHCHEGPHYYSYSMGSSIPGWMAYATYRKKNLDKVLPKKFLKTGRYVEVATTTVQEGGCHIPLCAAGQEEWPASLLLLINSYGDWHGGIACLQERLNNDFKESPLTTWDMILLLELFPVGSVKSRKLGTGLTSMKSGLSSYSWESPKRGKIIVNSERIGLGHHHLDRGNVILEAGGKILLPDLGMTNYSYSRCYLMREPDWHNLAYPAGLPMKVYFRPDDLPPRIKGGFARHLPPKAKANFHKVTDTSCNFKINLAPIYSHEVKRGLRLGTLILNIEEGRGELILVDEWEFTQPRSLVVAFQSYTPWVQVEQGKISFSAGKEMSLVSKEISSLPMKSEILTDRVDWNFREAQTLKITTEEAYQIRVSTSLVFKL